MDNVDNNYTAMTMIATASVLADCMNQQQTKEWRKSQTGVVIIMVSVSMAIVNIIPNVMLRETIIVENVKFRCYIYQTSFWLD